MNIAARWMQFASRRRAPYDAEVEYLESTGTQYIDTGIYYAPGTTTAMRVMFTSSATAAIFGARTATNTTKCYDAMRYAYGNGGDVNVLRFDYCLSGTSSTTQNFTAANSAPLDSATDYTFADGVVSYSGGSITAQLASQEFTTDYPLYLFAVNTAGTATTTTAPVRYYSCSITQNGVLVRDFIPVRVGTVGYLYDRVSGGLFANAGSGAFTIGSDI